MDTNTIKTSIQAVIDGLTPLAEKLQQPAEKIWEMAIKNNYVVVAQELFATLVFIILCFILYKVIGWGFTKKEGSDDNNFYYNGGIMITTIFVGVFIGILGVIVITLAIPDIISRLINPEFNAMKDLIEMFANKNI